jgi:hypothetical protein
MTDVLVLGFGPAGARSPLTQTASKKKTGHS